MSQYYFIWNVFFCYAAVAVTCAGCAIAHLLIRFKSSNPASKIMIGEPQSIFYLLNIGAGLLVLFGSEAMGSTEITKTALTNLSLAIVKASLLAVATFISLRATLSTPTSSEYGEKKEHGPGRLFSALLENIELRIDQNRMVDAIVAIKKIEKLPTPRAILNVILPYCFDQAEKDAWEGDREKITSALEAIYNGNRDIHRNERSILMLNHLHKAFGISVINSAIKLIENEDVGLSNGTVDGNLLGAVDRGGANTLKSTDSELDGLLQQLNQNT